MTLEQLKAFLEKAKSDQSIQCKLNDAKSPEHVVDIAKEHGHEFTIDKLTELNDSDLEDVAGGNAGREATVVDGGGLQRPKILNENSYK